MNRWKIDYPVYEIFNKAGKAKLTIISGTFLCFAPFKKWPRFPRPLDLTQPVPDDVGHPLSHKKE